MANLPPDRDQTLVFKNGKWQKNKHHHKYQHSVNLCIVHFYFEEL